MSGIPVLKFHDTFGVSVTILGVSLILEHGVLNNDSDAILYRLVIVAYVGGILCCSSVTSQTCLRCIGKTVVRGIMRQLEYAVCEYSGKRIFRFPHSLFALTVYLQHGGVVLCFVQWGQCTSCTSHADAKGATVTDNDNGKKWCSNIISYEFIWISRTNLVECLVLGLGI